MKWYNDFTAVGLFVFFLAASLHAGKIDSLIINLKNLSEPALNLFRISLLTIGIGLLWARMIP